MTPRTLIPPLLALFLTGCAFDAAPVEGLADAGPGEDAFVGPKDVPLPPNDIPGPKDVPLPDPNPDPEPKPDIPLFEDEDTGSMNDDRDACLEVCGRVFDCLGEICDFEGALGQSQEAFVDDCVDQCLTTPNILNDADQTLANTCVQNNDNLCRRNPVLYDVCGCLELSEEETNVGDPCVDASACEGGSRTAQCIEGVDEMGMGTGFVDGYCTVLGCERNLDCGQDNWCVNINQGQSRACFDACRPSRAPGNCRDGYGCWSVNGFPDAGICLQACDANDDCPGDVPCVNGGCVAP